MWEIKQSESVLYKQTFDPGIQVSISFEGWRLIDLK